MATVTIDVNDLPARFDEVLKLLEGGTSVEVRGGASGTLQIPAQIKSPVDEHVEPKRRLGLFSGEIWMADDFDAPLPDDFWADRP